MTIDVVASRTWKKPPFISDRRLRWAIGVGIAVYLAAALGTLDVDWGRVADGLPRGGQFIAAFFPPDFASRWAEIADGIYESLWMTVTSTVIGIPISIPVGLGAARNLAPTPVNSLIWALMLVTIVGPGVFAGIIAIGLRSIGFCGKLLYEAIEEIDHTQVEAVTATGAGNPQVVTYGIVPQVLPAFAGISVFRWDINIRESTVLGLVGAGGIGLQLNASIMSLAWTEVSMILIVIIATVIVSEWVSAKIRYAII